MSDNLKKESVVNPVDYVYGNDVKVEIPGNFLLDLIFLTEQVLKNEVKVESKFKYNYVDDKGKIIKNVTKEMVDSGKVRKVVDFDRTVIEPNLEYSITEKGLMYAEYKRALELIHFENINKGVAIKSSDIIKK